MPKSSGLVLVVDDDADFRAYLVDLLELAGLGASEAASGEEALRLAEEEKPALILLDVDLPGVSGHVVCRKLRDRFGESLPIILISGVRIDAHDRVSGLLLGADDYVLKPVDPSELLARIERLLPHPLQARPPAPAARFPQLTRREEEVLEFLVGGLDQEEIAERLFISEHTVAKHIQHILSKLGVHTRAQAVALAARRTGPEPD